jgi:hypothetical protein
MSVNFEYKTLFSFWIRPLADYFLLSLRCLCLDWEKKLGEGVFSFLLGVFTISINFFRWISRARVQFRFVVRVWSMYSKFIFNNRQSILDYFYFWENWLIGLIIFSIFFSNWKEFSRIWLCFILLTIDGLCIYGYFIINGFSNV